MTCEWWPSCDDEATHRVEIGNLESGAVTSSYYCTGHAERRIDELDKTGILEFAGIKRFRQPNKV